MFPSGPLRAAVEVRDLARPAAPTTPAARRRNPATCGRRRRCASPRRRCRRPRGRRPRRRRGCARGRASRASGRSRRCRPRRGCGSPRRRSGCVIATSNSRPSIVRSVKVSSSAWYADDRPRDRVGEGEVHSRVHRCRVPSSGVRCLGTRGSRCCGLRPCTARPRMVVSLPGSAMSSGDAFAVSANTSPAPSPSPWGTAKSWGLSSMFIITCRSGSSGSSPARVNASTRDPGLPHSAWSSSRPCQRMSCTPRRFVAAGEERPSGAGSRAGGAARSSA